MRVFLSLISILLLIVIGAALVVPMLLDVEKYKPQILAQIEEASCYRVAIDGALSLSILPTPSVSTQGLSVTKSGYDTPFVSVDSASIQVALLPLLSRTVQISSITLDGMNAALIQTQEGDNFMPLTGNGAQAGSDDSASPPTHGGNASDMVRIDVIELSDAQVTYNEMPVSLPHMKVRMDTLQGPFSLNGTVGFQAMLYQIEARLGSLQDKQSIPVQADIAMDQTGAEFKFAGTLTLADAPQAEGEIELDIADLAMAVGALSGQDGPDPLNGERLSIRSSISGGLESLALSQGQLTFKQQTLGLEGTATNMATDQRKVTLALSDLPGEGALSLSYDADAVAIDVEALRLRPVLQDWLALLPADASDMPLPDALSGLFTLGLSADGPVTLSMRNVTLDEQRVDGTLSYVAKDDGKALLTVALEAGALTLNTLPQTAASETGGSAAAPSQNKGFTLPEIQELPVDLVFDIEAAGLSLPDIESGPVTLKGSWMGEKLTLTSAQLQGFNKADLSLSGVVEDITAYEGVNVKGGMKTQDLAGFLKAFSVPPVMLGGQAVSAVQANIAYQGDAQSGQYDAQATAKGFHLQATGRITDPLNAGMPDKTTLKITHESTNTALKTLVPGLSPRLSGGFSLTSGLSMQGKQVSLSDMIVKAGSLDLAGDVSVNLSGARPSMTADLTSSNLPVSALLGTKSSQGGGGTASSSRTSGASSASPWSRDAMNTDALRAFDADVTLQAETLQYEQWVLKDVDAKARLSAGQLSVERLNAGVFGGTMAMKMALDAPQARRPVVFSQEMTFTNVDMASLVKAVTKQRKETVTGKADLSLNLKSTGISSSALVYALSGTGQLSVSNPVVNGIDLEGLDNTLKNMNSSNFMSSLGSVATTSFGSGSTAFKDIVHPFAVTQGTVTLENFIIETANEIGRVTVNGPISLSEWSMALRSDVELVREAGTPLATITLSGPLNAPKKSVKSDALRTLVNQKWGGQITDTLNDVLGERGSGLIQNLLGVGQQPSQEAEQPANDNTQTDTQAPATPPIEQEAEKLIRGLFDRF